MPPARPADPALRPRRVAAGVAALGVLGIGVLGVDVPGVGVAGPAPAFAAEPAFALAEGPPPLGLATDHVRDRYWVLTASRGRLTLHAYTAAGVLEGSMNSRDTLTNAQAIAFVDGEAYVGDVGGRRQEVAVHRVTEPWPGTEINRAPAYRLSYPDGEHEAAAILVDADHRIMVVTTGEQSGLYQAPESVSPDEPAPLTRLTDVPDGVTDATVLVDGRLALRTATTVLVLDPKTRAVLGQAELGVEEEGHALTQAVDQKLVLTGASADRALSTHPIPGPAPTQPTARPVRPRAPVPAVPAEVEETRSISQPGTTTAIVAALGVAALAAVVVLLRR